MKYQKPPPAHQKALSNQRKPTSDYKLEILDILKLEPHRIGSHSDDYGGESDKPCYCTATQALTHLINKARIDELYHLKYAFTEKKDEYLDKMLDLRIATIESQSEGLQSRGEE